MIVLSKVQLNTIKFYTTFYNNLSSILYVCLISAIYLPRVPVVNADEKSYVYVILRTRLDRAVSFEPPGPLELVLEGSVLRATIFLCYACY